MQCIENSADCRRSGRAHPPFQPGDGLLESLALDGLEQVVDGTVIESADRILIVGRREHNMSARARRTRDLQSCQAGHANVEKCDLRLQARQRLERGKAVVALRDDVQLRP